jgi:hypothetical protein
MRDGTLKLNFENGQITSLFENAGLDNFYSQIFANARRSIARSPENLKAGIFIVIFGIFYIEALSNRILREVVINESHDSAYGTINWEIIKRASLLDKLRLIFSLSVESLKAKYNELLPEIKKTIELRNRLAHFKDSDSELIESITSMEDLIEIFEGKNDPPLIMELKSPLISTHAKNISTLSQLLKRFEKKYLKSKGLKTTKII